MYVTHPLNVKNITHKITHDPMKPYRYLLLTTLSLTLFACTGEDGDTPVVPPVNPGTPVALSVQLANVAITKGGAVTDDISEISLYAVNNVSGETTYGTPPNGTYGKYTKQPGGAFAPADADNTIWLNNQEAKIYSCYPAVANVSGIAIGGTTNAPSYTRQIPANTITLAPTSFMYDNDQTTIKALDFASPESDYMYGVKYTASPSETFGPGQPTASNQNESIAIGLQHAFSQIRLVIKKGDTYQNDPKITSVTLSVKQPFLNSSGSSTMSLIDGTLSGLTTPGSGATDYNVTYIYDLKDANAATLTSSVTALSITNYILPSTAGIPYKISITVDGKAMDLSGTTEPLATGKINIYTISIHGTGLKLDGFHVVTWEPDEIEVTDNL